MLAMIYVKTAAGHRVLKDRSVPLSPRQRAAFILVDGKRSAEDLLRATGATGVTMDDLGQLAALGLVEDAARRENERFAQAHPLAVQLSAALGLNGYRLNVAVEAATSYQELLALAPKLEEALGPAYAPLHNALNEG
jgi:hypothetical protein